MPVALEYALRAHRLLLIYMFEEQARYHFSVAHEEVKAVVLAAL
jgi:hypothetical protein